MKDFKVPTTIEEFKKERGGILPPKYDIVFQRLFSKGHEDITKGFLEDILDIKIAKIDLDKSKDIASDRIIQKNGRLDVRATLNDNTNCNIEVQLEAHKGFTSRIIYYWSKIYTADFYYNKLKKTVAIAITDNESEELKLIKDGHSIWHIRNDKTNECLTDKLEIHIINISKTLMEYKSTPENKIAQWMYFFENPQAMEV